jgi:hypothetical protein
VLSILPPMEQLSYDYELEKDPLHKSENLASGLAHVWATQPNTMKRRPTEKATSAVCPAGSLSKRYPTISRATPMAEQSFRPLDTLLPSSSMKRRWKGLGCRNEGIPSSPMISEGGASLKRLFRVYYAAYTRGG